MDIKALFREQSKDGERTIPITKIYLIIITKNRLSISFCDRYQNLRLLVSAPEHILI